MYNITLPFVSIFSDYQIGITIVDDNQWEPDEEFFVKLTLIPGEDSENVKLGKTCIMEITILNDDGTLHINFHCSLYDRNKPIKIEIFL